MLALLFWREATTGKDVASGSDVGFTCVVVSSLLQVMFAAGPQQAQSDQKFVSC